MKYTTKQIIDIMQAKGGKPLLVRELMRLLRLKPEDRHPFKLALAGLTQKGEIIKTRGNRYGLPEKMDLVTGKFQAHPSGYGFVLAEKKGDPDVFVSIAGRLDAMDGDMVAVRVSAPAGKRKLTGKREGAIVRIVERAQTKIVGTYVLSEDRSGSGFVESSNPRITQNIIISRENAGNAHPGDIVSAEIIAYPLRNRPPEGKIVRIIGKPGQPGIDSELIIEQYELPVQFSPAVLRESESISQQVTPAMRTDRQDLRELTTVTIDGEKARDFDDAISIQRIRLGYRLWVHIADVAHYVVEDTLLDQEAYQRGTSVYLPDRAIPMLPTPLSNGICSLNPAVDRLTLTCEMDISLAGEIVKYDIYESVIKSDERMTYTAVRQILVDKDPDQRKRYAPILPEFELMEELMQILKAKRSKRGSIDFDLPEPEIVLETVASHVEQMEVPFIYRIHEEPAEDKVQDLADFLATLGINLPTAKKIKPLHLQKALAKAKGTPEEMLINTVLLRTMKQARYSTDNVGHFGLAAESYTHFTSPIRRYPDLIVHRILKASTRGLLQKEAYTKHLAATLPEAATHCSLRERTAMEAERDVITMLKLQFMTDKLGETYDGIITGTANFGLFVQLHELFVEGLVHISALTDDYYTYIEKLHCLRGEKRKKVYRIGDSVRVRVDKVDTVRKKIDFSLAE
jgi:ribonuclease R